MNSKKIIVFLLSFILAMTAVILPTVSAIESIDSAYDYSDPTSYFNTSISAADLIAELLGVAVSDGERAYLNAYCDFKVSYDRVTNSGVRIFDENGSTKVDAEAYSYTAANGKTVTWVPEHAKFTKDNVEYEQTFAPGSYSVFFEGVAIDETSPISIRYRISEDTAFTLSMDDINGILNLAYNKAKAIEGSLDLYTETPEKVLKYFDDILLHQEYLEQKAIYDELKAEFDQYLSDYADYEDRVDKYETYLDLEDLYYDIKDTNKQLKSDYDAAVKQYEEEYLPKLAVVESQLKTLNDGLMNSVALRSEPTAKRQVYACIFSNLVDQVVAQRDKLNKLGPNIDGYIESAATATKAIRGILKPENGKNYADLETVEEKYSFYRNVYADLRDNLFLLVQSLYAIYTSPGVKDMMHLATDVLYKPEYTEKLVVFIGQIMYLCDALYDQEIVFTDGEGKEHKIGDIKLGYREPLKPGEEKPVTQSPISFAEIFGEDNGFVVDKDNAKPLEQPFFERAEPKEPDYLEEIDKPDSVSEPGDPPEEVDDPGDPPTVVEYPTMPDGMSADLDWEKYLGDSGYKAILDGIYAALKSGELTDRTHLEFTSDVSYRPTLTVQKRRSSETVTVKFYDSDGNLLQTAGADKGDPVRYKVSDSPIPTKEPDITADYVFEAWVTESAEKYDLYSVNEDVSLYPSFKPIYKEYDIIGTDSKYLHVPVPEDILTRIPISHFMDVSVSAMSGLKITSENVVITVSYTSIRDLKAACVSHLGINADVSGGIPHSCTVTAYTEDGTAADVEAKIRVYLPCSSASFANKSILTYTDSLGDLRVAYKTYTAGSDASSGVIDFSATTGFTYTFAMNDKYGISHLSSLNGIVTYPEYAVEGEIITVSVNVPAGKTVTELYYILDGQQIKIEGNSFTMPAGSVRIGAKIADILYNVKFVSDGKVIAERDDYRYGDTVKLPNNPTKINDDKYSYKFTGWSPEFSETVTGDVTYVAQFEATLLPVVEKKITTFDIIFYAGIGFVALALLTGVTVIVITVIKRKKQKSEDIVEQTINAGKSDTAAKNVGVTRTASTTHAPSQQQPKVSPTTQTVKKSVPVQPVVKKPDTTQKNAENRPVTSAQTGTAKPTAQGVSTVKKTQPAVKSMTEKTVSNPNTRVEK